MATKFAIVSGGGASVAKAASTANLTLSGAQTVDGVSLIAGNICLVKNQTTSSQNGLYTVSAGVWTKISQPVSVYISSGTLSSGLNFFLSATNTYTASSGAYA